MNNVTIVPPTISNACEAIHRRAGRLLAMVAARLGRPVSWREIPQAAVMPCGHPDCRSCAGWSGSVTLTCIRPRDASPITLTYELPLLCNEHASAAAYFRRLPAELAAKITRELASAGYAPSNVTTEIELRAA